MIDEGGNPSYRVALPEFEGPLDLLLHLCKTNEIDIVNISISFITQKYLEYLDVMQSLSVDVAADYLVMAATLAYLKSRELVPTPEPLEVDSETGEEVGDPREELIRRLLEYRKYKDAAEQLGGRPIEGKNIFGRGMPVKGEGDGELIPFAEHSVWKLIEAFGKLLEKAGPRIVHEVAFDRVSISARINQIIDRLEQGGGAFRFDALFSADTPEPELRSQLVVTLLAILELARLHVVRVLASDDQQTLFIAQVEGTALEEARHARITSGDEPELAPPDDMSAESASEPPTETTSASTDEALAAVTDQTPAASTDETLAAVTETPAASTDEALAAVTDQTPAASTDETLAAVTDEAPAAVTDETPAAVTDETPVVAESGDVTVGDDLGAGDDVGAKESHEEA